MPKAPGTTPIFESATNALAAAIPSTDAAALHAELGAAITAQEAAVMAAEAATLDPLHSVAALEPVVQDALAASLHLKRMRALHDRLGARIEELQRDEAAVASIAEYDAAKLERDELADWLRTRYAAMVAELAEKASAIAASNERLARINTRLPADRSWLYPAESIGRDRMPNASTPSIVTSMKLPAPRDCGVLAYPPPASQGGFADEIRRQLANVRQMAASAAVEAVGADDAPAAQAGSEAGREAA